jgi:DNA ligase (NAD+)
VTESGSAPLTDDIPAAVHQEWAELAEQAAAAQFAYHVKDAPTISDGEYDGLIRELNELEESYPELRTPDSPTQKVGGDVSTLFTAVEHAERMMSLDNAFSPEDLGSWAARLDRDGATKADFLLELKVDGVAINLTY